MGLAVGRCPFRSLISVPSQGLLLAAPRASGLAIFSGSCLLPLQVEPWKCHSGPCGGPLRGKAGLSSRGHCLAVVEETTLG